MLVGSELVTNVVRHSAAGDLHIQLRPERLLVQVCDESSTVPRPHRRRCGVASATGRGLRSSSRSRTVGCSPPPMASVWLEVPTVSGTAAER